jgi:hypothetical protein
MHTTALNAGQDSHAPHTHVQEEIILIVEECCYIDGKLQKDQQVICILSANVPHALKYW